MLETLTICHLPFHDNQSLFHWEGLQKGPYKGLHILFASKTKVSTNAFIYLFIFGLLHTVYLTIWYKKWVGMMLLLIEPESGVKEICKLTWSVD